MLFDYLKSIVCTKITNLSLEQYVPYLITRWLSFSSEKAVPALNETVNCLSTLTKEQHYKLLLILFPKHSYFKKIDYVKRVTLDRTEKEEIEKIQIIAQNLEMSKREILNYQQTVEFLALTSK